MNALLRHSAALVGAAVGLPVAAVGLALRPAWRSHFGERLGGIDAGAMRGGVWLHASSLGEVRAAAQLVPGVRAAGRPVVVSTSTVAARAQVPSRCGEVAFGLMPLDHPWTAARALARVDPQALVLIETELWPSWIAAAERRAVPVIVLSARLSDANFARLRRLRRFLGPTMARLAAVGARSEEDASRFVELGADPGRVQTTGDLKLAAAATSPSGVQDFADDLGALCAALAKDRLWVAGSVHPGEFAPVLDALDQVEASGNALRLVIAPRHLEETEALVREIRRRGRPVLLRTRWQQDLEVLGGRGVVVLDTHGELSRLYARAVIAFVGGSLTPVGGHDLLEPIVAGAPVLFGPHTQNQRAARELLLASGAGKRVATGLELGHVLIEELIAVPASEDRTEAARARLAAHRSAVERSLELVTQCIEAPASARGARR